MFCANSVDPDQTPSSAASDQGLQCLLTSFHGTLDINLSRYFQVPTAHTVE